MKKEKVLYNVYVVQECTDEYSNSTRYCRLVCQTMAVSQKKAENNARFNCNTEIFDMYAYIAEDFAGTTWERWYHAEIAAFDHGEFVSKNNYTYIPDCTSEKQLSLFDLVTEGE